MKGKLHAARLCAAVALLLAAPPALTSALEIPKPEVFISFSGGALAGEAGEFVYDDNKKLSSLVWPLETMRVYAFGERFVWNRKFGVSADLSLGIPGDAGTMTDSDFLNVNINGSGAKTHYSEHDARVDHFVSFNCALSWTFETPANGPGSARRISLAPAAGFRYLSVKWTGSGGYTQYGSFDGTVWTEWNASLPKTGLSGKVISYRQEYFIPTLGITVKIPVARRLLFEAGITGSPAVWCDAVDNHVLTHTDYHDYLSGGFMAEPSARVEWMPTDTITFFADGKWIHASGLRGKTQAVNTLSGSSTWYGKADGGGAEFTAGTISFGITTKLQ